MVLRAARHRRRRGGPGRRARLGRSARCSTRPATGSPTPPSSRTIAWYYAEHGQRWMLLAALLCLVLGSLTSYIRARAEAAGLTATVGIAERAERLIIVLVGTGLTGLPGVHVPYVLAVALWLLVAASAITVAQRFATVYAQSRSRDRVRRPECSTGSATARSGSATPPAGAWSRRCRAGCPRARSGPRPTRRPCATAAGTRQLRKNLRRVVGPGDVRAAHGRARRRGAALLLALLAGDVPARGDGPRGRRGDHRGATASAASTSTPALAARQGRDPGAAALGQLGRRRASGWSTAAGRSRRWPSGCKPESVFDRFVAYRESLGHGGRRADRRRAPADRGAGRAAAAERRRLPARRPRPVAQRHRGRLLRRADPHAGRPGDAGGDDRRRAARACTTASRATGWAITISRADRAAARGGCASKVARGTQAMADFFAEGIARLPGRLAHAAAAVARRPAARDPRTVAPTLGGGGLTCASASSARTPGTSPAASRPTSATSPRS